MTTSSITWLFSIQLLAQAPQTPPPAPPAVPAAPAPAAPAPAVDVTSPAPPPTTPAPEAAPAPAAPAATPAAPETPAPAAPLAAALPRVWVAPLQATGLDSALVAVINESIVSEAKQVGGHDVITESDLAALLSQEQRAQVLGCQDPSCFTDLGKAARADKVLSCTAAKAGLDVLLACRVVGVKEAAQLASKDRKVPDNITAIADAARALVGLVLTGQARERRGLVELKVSEPGAGILVDGREVGQSPMKEPVRLDEGKREIIIKKGGYATWRSTLDVQAGSYTVVDAQLAATRAIQLWPFGVAALAFGAAALGLGVSTGLGLGITADCLYWGEVRGYGEVVRTATGNAPPAAPMSAEVCRRLPAATPAYKQRPIDSYTVADRETQVLLVGNVGANVAYGAALFAAGISLAAGVALVVTDVIIRTVRREE
ncbi:MAG: PEGA domain-containing protein [Myxococcota bacterium]